MKINWFFCLALLIGCGTSHSDFADLLIINGNIATMDEQSPKAEALAIRDSRIIKVGSNSLIAAYKGDNTKVIDAEGRFVMPGFIEGHGHFSGLGSSLRNLNFLKSSSWEEIVQIIGEKATKSAPGEWIMGRGWHQEKWSQIPEENIHGYPIHNDLSAISPNNPVLLTHASGHGTFANKAAMDAAGISKETMDPVGGEIVRDRVGEPIGMFEETAQRLLQHAYEDYLGTFTDKEKLAQWHDGIKLAEEICFENGITSFQDAGSSFELIKRYRQLAGAGELDLRLWVMILDDIKEIKKNLASYPMIGLGEDKLSVAGIKTSIDGALGSFGAWLLESYADKPNFVGQNITPIAEVEALAGLAYGQGLQLCVHAIGDRANREVLDIYEKSYEKAVTDGRELRWRIEHAQHLSPDDIPRFGAMGVIAAMQGIHCTSDAPYVEKRLGENRSREGAYAWRYLLDAGAVIANGTDTPVEDVNPVASFYASVTRRRVDNGMEFYPAQSMTRHEALRSYTIDAAYAVFEEDIKGSIEEGKLGDITILSRDLLHCSDQEILNCEVLYTIVGGNVKYQKEL